MGSPEPRFFHCRRTMSRPHSGDGDQRNYADDDWDPRTLARPSSTGAHLSGNELDLMFNQSVNENHVLVFDALYVPIITQQLLQSISFVILHS